MEIEAANPEDDILLPKQLTDKESRRKLRCFMAGEMEVSNTNTTTNSSRGEMVDVSNTTNTASMTSNSERTTSLSSSGKQDRLSSRSPDPSVLGEEPMRGDGFKRTNSESSAQSLSFVKIHSSNSTRNISTSDFTIDKLRFSSLGRLYGREKEVKQLENIIHKKALKRVEPPLKSSLNNGADSDDDTQAMSTGAVLGAHPTPKEKKRVGFQDESSGQVQVAQHQKQLIMISGAAGSGKSVLALKAVPLVREQQGFYLSGKHDRKEHQKPFAAIASAFQSLCEDLVLHKRAQGDAGSNSSDHTVYQRWTFNFSDFAERIHETFEEEEIQLLNTIIPSLRRVTDVESGYSSESSEFFLNPSSRSFQVEQELQDKGVTTYAFSNSATPEDYAEHKARIQSAFKRFVKLVCSFGPLVFVLDDVQWIDLPSLELLQSLLQDKDTPAMTIIVTYRDSEVDEHHIWQQLVNTLETKSRDLNVKIQRMHVDTLDVDDICALLEDLISMQPDETRPLAECVHVKTGGNALYVKEFLLSLHRDELLTFEFRMMKWEWDVEEIKMNAKSTDNVVALLNSKIKELPAPFSRLLPRVACLGCRFSLPVFDVVAENSVTDEELKEAEKYLQSIRAASNNMHSSGATKATEGSSQENGSDDDHSEMNPSEETPAEQEVPVPMVEVEEKPKEKRSGNKRVTIKEPREDGVSVPQSKTGMLLAICKESGFLIAFERGWYQWEHDKIQEAALLFVGEEELPAFQFEVGKLLLQELPEDNLAEVLFVVTSLLNTFTESLDEKDELKIQIADMNYRSSVAAYQAAAFESAADFAQKGITLLPADKFTSHYSLALELHELAAESLFSNGDYEKAREYADAVIKLDIDLLDKRRVYKAFILSLAGQGMVTEAKDLTVEVLEQLGVKFPKRMRSMHVLAGVVHLTGSIKKMTQKIDKLETLTDERKVWAIDFLDRLVTYSYQAGDPDLLSLTMMKGTNLIAKWGVSDKAGPLLASAGLLLVIVGNYAGAKKYAELALKYANRATEARVRLISYRHVLHYQISTTVCKKAQMQGYYAGMKTGDLESAFWCCYGFCDDQLLAGVKLSIVVKDFAMYSKQVSQYHHVMADRCFRLGWQSAVNLIEGNSGEEILNGDIMNEAEMMAEIDSDKSDGQTIYNLKRMKILGCFWFKEFDEVVKICEEMGFHKGALEKAVPGLSMTAAAYFHCALACLSESRKYQENKKGKHRKMAEFFRSRIKDWSRKGSPNTQHYLTLIDAEFLSFKPDNGEAKRLYERSIHTAGRLGMSHDQAMAHERLAENCLRLGYQNDAKYHFVRARELFKDWGAHARADIVSQGLLSVAPAREVIPKKFSSCDVSALSAGGVSGVTGLSGSSGSTRISAFGTD